MTVTDFRSYYSDELHKYSSAQIGQVLEKLGIKSEQKRLFGSRFPSHVRKLPRISYK